MNVSEVRNQDSCKKEKTVLLTLSALLTILADDAKTLGKAWLVGWVLRKVNMLQERDREGLYKQTVARRKHGSGMTCGTVLGPRCNCRQVGLDR